MLEFFLVTFYLLIGFLFASGQHVLLKYVGHFRTWDGHEDSVFCFFATIIFFPLAIAVWILFGVGVQVSKYIRFLNKVIKE